MPFFEHLPNFEEINAQPEIDMENLIGVDPASSAYATFRVMPRQNGKSSSYILFDDELPKFNFPCSIMMVPKVDNRHGQAGNCILDAGHEGMHAYYPEHNDGL